MICCKIISDFQQNPDKFSKLYGDISKKGYCLFIEGNLFYYSLEDKVTINKIKVLLKKHGFTNYYINVYDKDNNPRESDFINGWLTDGLVKISIKDYETVNQQKMREIKEGLEKLNLDLDQRINDLKKKQETN